MLQEVMWAYCDQFYVVLVLSALWYYDQQKSEVGRGRDWEEWDSDCHRTSDSDSSSNFDIQSMCLDMVNIFRITIVTCRPIWKWSVFTHPWAHLLVEVVTACLDTKEDRSKKSALVCDGWSGFLGVASDLPRGSYRKGKEHYLICFLARRGWIYWSLLWHGYNLKTRRWQQNFRFVPRGRGVMAVVVGSFTLWLPTFARVATLLAFAKPWHYCMCGGNFFTFGGFEWCEVN